MKQKTAKGRQDIIKCYKMQNHSMEKREFSYHFKYT